MWDCIKCGCRAIAASLTTCPNRKCRRERDMPKATAGGSSNAWEANEPGYVPVVAEVAPAEPAVAPEPTPEPEPVQAVSEPPAATKPKAAPKPSGPDVTVTVT